MIRRRHGAVAAAAACLLAAIGGAQAQGVDPARLARGPQLSANLFGGWDAPLFDPSAAASLQPTGQWFTGADAGVTWIKAWRRVALSSQATLSNRYYPKFTPSTAPSYGGSIGLQSTGTGRWQWGVSQFVQYAPFSAVGLFASALGPNAQALQLANATTFQQSTVRQLDVTSGASIAYRLSRRTSVASSFGVATLVPIDSPVARALRLNGTLRLSRQLTRDLTGYVGYSRSQNRVASSDTTAGANYTVEGFDFGVDFSRGLQLGRDTTLGLRTGVVKVPETRQQYQLTGTATLDRTFRRGWLLQLAATRDARFVQTYRNSVVFYGVSASARGRLTDIFGISFSTNYSSGTINAGSDVGFSSYSGVAQLRHDFRRNVATFAEYAAFWSKVDASTLLAGQPTGEFGRHSVRVGLSFGLSPFDAVSRVGRQ
jgi:hypothetical protein